jgi:hypothetical protein
LPDGLGTLEAMVVKAWLEGHQFDLDALVALLPTGDTQVVRDDDGGYYLTAAEIDDRPADTPFYEVAPAVLRRVNGLARVHDAGFRPVALSGRYQDGHKGHLVVAGATAECRVRATAGAVLIGGEPAGQTPMPTGPAHAAIACSDGDVDDALTIMGGDAAPSWVELYRVYEIVKHTGRLSDVLARAGVSASEVDLFKRTANHPNTAGVLARHGRSKQAPPEAPILLTRARELISELVLALMELPR